MNADNASFNPWVMLLYLILAGLLVSVALMPSSRRDEMKDAIFGPRVAQPKGPWHFMCNAEDCGYEKTAGTLEEFRKVVDTGQRRRQHRGHFEPLVLPCPQCENESLYHAEFCPNCQKMYIPEINMTPFGEDTTDACPRCTWSPSEERLRRWRKEQEKRENR